MDTGTIRDELVASVRLPLTQERWLLGSALGGLLAFGIWVGATAAALTYGLEFVGRSLTVEPWTTTTTAVFGVGVVAWILLPATAATYGVSQGLTNVRGNIARCYRFAHPFLLVGPPLVLVGVLAGLGGVRGTVSEPLAVALVVASTFLVVRTLAYSYRVFSLSIPVLLRLFLFVTLGFIAFALLAGITVAAGRGTFLESVLTGVGDLAGLDLTWLAGSTTVASVTVPTLPMVAAGLPAVLSLLYLVVQSVVGVVFRLWAPDVPRSNLRTGQRYPRFARPTTVTSQEQTGTVSEANGGADDTEPEVSDRGPGDTRLFTTPGEANADGLARSSPAGTRGQETVVAGDTTACPACGERIASDADYTYCPVCGTPLTAPEA